MYTIVDEKGINLPFVKETLHVTPKQRLFLYLIKELGHTHKEAQRVIAKGRVLQNGIALTKASQEVEGEIEFIYFKPESRGLQPLHVTDEFVVFDKPSGMLIHPQNRYTPYSLIDELKFQFGKDANITHRIDQETSGLVLCARNKTSERDIKMMFEHRKMQKVYLAMVHGYFEKELVVEEPLLRKEDPSAIVRMVVKVDPSGKPSKTSFKPLKYFPDLNMTLVECKPHTGRQHQIRVHLFHVKHPIVGDPIYGQKEEDIVRFLDKQITLTEREKLSGASRLLLHASQLDFELYGNNYHISSSVDFEQTALNVIADLTHFI